MVLKKVIGKLLVRKLHQPNLFGNKDVNALRNLKVSIHRKIPVCFACRLLHDNRFKYDISIIKKENTIKPINDTSLSHTEWFDREFELELAQFKKDAQRYRWLRQQFAQGRESYIGEDMSSEEETDKYIDNQMKKQCLSTPT